MGIFQQRDGVLGSSRSKEVTLADVFLMDIAPQWRTKNTGRIRQAVAERVIIDIDSSLALKC